jgi:hypothetical protein
MTSSARIRIVGIEQVRRIISLCPLLRSEWFYPLRSWFPVEDILSGDEVMKVVDLISKNRLFYSDDNFSV